MSRCIGERAKNPEENWLESKAKIKENYLVSSFRFPRFLWLLELSPLHRSIGACEFLKNENLHVLVSKQTLF